MKHQTRRGRRGQSLLTVYFCNINGYASKQHSLNTIIDRTIPDIVVLCETKATGACMSNFFKPKGYEVLARPGGSPNMGGIMIGTRRCKF